jgi:hypothetical protein
MKRSLLIKYKEKKDLKKNIVTTNSYFLLFLDHM